MTSEISKLHYQLQEQLKFLKSLPLDTSVVVPEGDPTADRILDNATVPRVEPALCAIVAALSTVAEILHKNWLCEKFADRLADPKFVEELTSRLQEDPVGWDGEPPKETASESESL